MPWWISSLEPFKAFFKRLYCSSHFLHLDILITFFRRFIFFNELSSKSLSPRFSSTFSDTKNDTVPVGLGKGILEL
ncbi:hypothetical protein TIFTF001_056856 [Ficus carica]|uniref:Uncharacterized protein n=1 Tax=Ficus carica TaxID=3494 RepID=A0AA88JIG6_FICCA|nr:hypothetical protein TIFTF001_056856 [Ficus carica]